MKLKKEKNIFYQRLKEDWGKDDVFGPWTDMTKFKKGEIPFFKSYWLITTNDSPNIESINSWSEISGECDC